MATAFESTPVVPGGARPALRAYRRLGRYQVLWVLGRGAEAAVYASFDPELARRVALKVYEGTDRMRGNRLLRGARMAAQLIHPNIVTTFDFIREGDSWAIVQELLPGTDLERATLTPEARSASLRDVARAMAYAHERGIAHLDLKPSNVFATEGGAFKVLDFGLARDLSPMSVETLPLGASNFVGTPLFMAPELFDGKPPTLYTDVWSFGVMSYKMLTGAYPFEGSSVNALARAVCVDPIPRASMDRLPASDTSHRDQDMAIAMLVDACLNRSPEARPSFREIRDGLEMLVR